MDERQRNTARETKPKDKKKEKKKKKRRRCSRRSCKRSRGPCGPVGRSTSGRGRAAAGRGSGSAARQSPTPSRPACPRRPRCRRRRRPSGSSTRRWRRPLRASFVTTSTVPSFSFFFVFSVPNQSIRKSIDPCWIIFFSVKKYGALAGRKAGGSFRVSTSFVVFFSNLVAEIFHSTLSTWLHEIGLDQVSIVLLSAFLNVSVLIADLKLISMFAGSKGLRRVRLTGFFFTGFYGALPIA